MDSGPRARRAAHDVPDDDPAGKEKGARRGNTVAKGLVLLLLAGVFAWTYFWFVFQELARVQDGEATLAPLPAKSAGEAVKARLPPGLQQQVKTPEKSELVKPAQATPPPPPLVAGDDDDIHIIFSTGCNLFQHWQAQVLLASAAAVGQRGHITRLVSGCEGETHEIKPQGNYMLTHPVGKADDIVPREELEKSVYPRYSVYITPTFEGAVNYPWLNKPQSIEHWIAHTDVKESVIAIVDPDFVFVAPLKVNQPESKVLHSFSEFDKKKYFPEGLGSFVKKGHPVGQYYGIGGQWVDYAKDICGEGQPCTQYDHRAANDFFAVGPPYILHRDDLKALAPLYTIYMKKIVKIRGADILTDMYAYASAAAQLHLRHARLDHYMISAWNADGEAWPWVNPDVWDSCSSPLTPPGDKEKVPTFLHYCQNYGSEDKTWTFHKGHVPANILDCNLPLMVEGPPDLMHRPGKFATANQKKRLWQMCAVVGRINNALKLYKDKYCPLEDKNLEKRFKIDHGDHSRNCRDKGEVEGVNCWQMAHLVTLEEASRLP